MKKWISILILPFLSFVQKEEPSSWIRINQLGYTPGGIKVAVWCSKEEKMISEWQLIDANTNQVAASGKTSHSFGAYGPFKQSCRLDFSSFKKSGVYFLQAGGVKSPWFEISEKAYRGGADFCLQYMRQQRSGFNPFLRDSCHTHDGYTLYAEKAGLPDSTYVDVVGGWHDASDYLQYSATSANATYHLLAAYRDFPKVFTDERQANGLKGKNGLADVLDEAKWGLDWLLKMNPSRTIMFNQVGDDRDHQGMRIPKEDSFYGRGYERPVYFVSGEPQQRGKYMNATTGTSSTAAKFASVFALADYFQQNDSSFLKNDTRPVKFYFDKALQAYQYGLKKAGVTQTASVRSPYIYAEENWVDDMELASACLNKMINSYGGNGSDVYLQSALRYASQEKITPWLGSDTANHYQWYPFINLGHYEVATQLKNLGHGLKEKYSGIWNYADTVTSYYLQGIRLVWNKAKQNAFYRGIPFIWCSNNLTVAFAIQCYWYKQLSGDKTFDELEQANFDWLFGCNPWGAEFVSGLPYWGNSLVDPHSAFSHLKNYPVDGGLVDGPVSSSIYKSLIGIKLYEPDEYAAFQSDLAVYHDDYGDYSTNEPTMDGTASLIYLLAAKEAASSEFHSQPSPARTAGSVASEGGASKLSSKKKFSYNHGGIIRGDSTQRKIALVFTGHEFAEGGDFIAGTLQKEKIKASFFFTGDFYRNDHFKKMIQGLKRNGNYLGPHSDKHLLYCDWNERDSLLLSKKEFSFDLADNYTAMARQGIAGKKASFFLPPFEWYNDSNVAWAKELKLQLINYTPGTLSHADYTTDHDKNYRSSETIYHSILDYERSKPAGLNGFILLMHIGAGPKRTDKFYARLPELIKYLKAKGYQFQRVDELLKAD